MSQGCVFNKIPCSLGQGLLSYSLNWAVLGPIVTCMLNLEQLRSLSSLKGQISRALRKCG